MTKLFKQMSSATQKKWQELAHATIGEALHLQDGRYHERMWTVKEAAKIANLINEREEIFTKYADKKKVLVVFKPTSSFMKKLVNGAQTNGGNAVWDLDYESPRFGECGYVVRVNTRVPYGLMKHMTVVPKGCAKRCFELVFNMGDKFSSVEVAAEELDRIPGVDPYLTILLSLYHLKRGDHGFEEDVAQSMLTTLRLLEKELYEYTDERFDDFMGGMVLLPEPLKSVAA